MRRFLGWLFLALALPVLLLATLAFLATDGEPLVHRDSGLSPAAIDQAKRLFAAHDPRRLAPGQRRTAVIPLAMLDAGAQHLASRYLGASAAVGVDPHGLYLRLSRPLAGGWRHLNLETELALDADQPRLAGARLGALRLPVSLVERLAGRALAAAGYAREWDLARQSVRRVALSGDGRQLLVSYTWNPELLDRARAIALPAADADHLQSAHERLVGALDRYPAASSPPLAPLLQELLAAGGDDLRQARRATLLALAFYLAEKNPAHLAPTGKWRPPRRVELTLAGRHDLAQHFVVSAALAAWSDQPVADAVGLYKELKDARSGSGFSFVDLTADRAGARFGDLVNQTDPRIEPLLRRPLTDADLLPAIAGLPEFLHDREFRRRFGDPDSPAYQAMATEVERRLQGLAWYP